MKYTAEDLKEFVEQISDTYIREYEAEVKFTEEKTKLILWIIGLSIGMELFVLSKVESKDLKSTWNMALFIALSAFFLVNALLGLVHRLKHTRMYSYFLTVICHYDHQKTLLLLNLDPDTDFGKRIITDCGDGTVGRKIKDLEYINQKAIKEDPILLADMNFLQGGDNIPSSLLVLQAVLSVAFCIKILF